MKKLRKHEIKGIDLHWHWWGNEFVYSDLLLPFCVCLKLKTGGFIVKHSDYNSNRAYFWASIFVWRMRRETHEKPDISVKYFNK